MQWGFPELKLGDDKKISGIGRQIMKYIIPPEKKKLKKVTEEIHGAFSITTTFQTKIMCNGRPTKFS